LKTSKIQQQRIGNSKKLTKANGKCFKAFQACNSFSFLKVFSFLSFIEKSVLKPYLKIYNRKCNGHQKPIRTDSDSIIILGKPETFTKVFQS